MSSAKGGGGGLAFLVRNCLIHYQALLKSSLIVVSTLLSALNSISAPLVQQHSRGGLPILFSNTTVPTSYLFQSHQ